MKIAKFGSVYASAYAFGNTNMVDTWGSTRPALIQAVSGASGAYSFTGVNPYPLAPITVSKRYTITAASSSAVDDARDALFNATMAHTRDYLWALDRDASTTYYAWAQCIGCTASESYDERGKWAKDVEVSFLLPEGFWYSGTAVASDIHDSGTVSTPQDTSFGGVTLSTGNLFSPLYFTFTVSAGPGTITQIIFTSFYSATPAITWQWDGTLSSGQSLIVDAASYTVTRAGADHYDEFTPPTNSTVWALISHTSWPTSLDTYRVQYTPAGGNVTIAYTTTYIKRYVL